ncbi:LPXTG-motif_cell wall anchor domain [Hexamita inflata]|uniref:LPXTG-motif cell wall anchor domain n=1 Tax=Hexamita inflata TaxID=28002 RepID=A0AA86TSL2_9EUKA|nr:LPXTG-motif cell wall anchor domain [Hexamita inflata]
MLIYIEILSNLFVTGINTNGNLGVQNSLIREFVQTGSGEEVSAFASNKLATIYQTRGNDLTYSMGLNSKGILCQPNNIIKLDQPTLIPGLNDEYVAHISMSETSSLLLGRFQKLYGCGSNANGELSLTGLIDTDSHILTQINTDFVKFPEDTIESIGSTKLANYIVLSDSIFILGPCQFENMCQKHDNGTMTLILPYTRINLVKFYPDTIVIVNYDGVIFVLGLDHCSPSKQWATWHISEFSQVEQFYFGRDVTIFSQNNSVYACGFQGLSGVMMKIEHNVGSILSVAANEKSVLIAGTNGLFVGGDNRNYVLGNCKNMKPGIAICQPQISTMKVDNMQIEVVEGYSSLIRIESVAPKYYYSKYENELLIESVFQAGDIWGGKQLNGIKYLQNCAQFLKIKCNQNGLLAKSQNGILWSFGDSISYEFGYQFPIKLQNPAVVPYFQDYNISQFDLSDSNGIALTVSRNGKLYTFGQNQNGNLGQTMYEYSVLDNYSGPKEIQIDFLQQGEDILQAGVVQKVYFIRTNIQLYYWGFCEGQCGSDSNGNIIFDDPDQDRSLIRKMNIKIQLDYFITFAHSIILISKDKKVYTFGLNDQGQLCQNTKYNQNNSVSEKQIPLSSYIHVGNDKTVIQSNNKQYFCGKNIMTNGKKIALKKKSIIYYPYRIGQIDSVKDISVQGDLITVLANNIQFQGYISKPEQFGLQQQNLDYWTSIDFDTSKVNRIEGVSNQEFIQIYILNDSQHKIINEMILPEEEEQVPEEEEQEEEQKPKPEPNNTQKFPIWQIILIVASIIIIIGIFGLFILKYIKNRKSKTKNNKSKNSSQNQLIQKKGQNVLLYTGI